MTREEFEEILNESKNLNDLPNQKLILFMDKLTNDFEIVKNSIINLTYQLDSIEILYNKILKEYENRI